MSEVREWLDKLGLGQYSEAFEENALDFASLPHVTDDDLASIGVPLGHRRLMQAALADAVSDEPSASASAASERQAPEPTDGAERRQITVMFCDLVGSTKLSKALDPEDLRTLMQAYQQAAGAVIKRYEGHVAQYLGDGLMVYFGWPQAHEDDAERAVRAALEIVDAVKAVEGARQPLQVRLGIATGPVVVGETGAGDASVPKLAVGETPNLASRVQGLAGPDEIVMAPSTRRLVGTAFTLTDLGERALKGIVEPVHAWRVTGLAHTKGRFEATRGLHLTPFVGREAEVALLMEKWEQALDGEGQVVLLRGESGIGKSRILQEVSALIDEAPHGRLRYQCSPYHTNSALHPVMEQLVHAAGFTPDDDASEKLVKLEALVGREGHAPALIAALLRVDAAGRYPSLGMSPQKQKEETLKTIARQVVALASGKPVLVLFEDAHWIDPTTQEALDVLVPQIANRRVLVLVTFRPEYNPLWPQGLGHVTELNISRLGRRQAVEIVAQVTGGKPLPDEILNQIVAKTDGVPLFVEELTKTVVESDVVALDEAGSYRATTGRGALAVPSTLQDSLMARLDRLRAVKVVAQIGACIGREFSHALLAAVADLGDDELQGALDQLIKSELVFPIGSVTDVAYTFKHALVQDAAYSSLLKSRRQHLHKAIAQAIQEQFSTIVERDPERIAQHLTEAGLYKEAMPHWLAAGSRAATRCAHAEAMSHLTKGLDLLRNLPESPKKSEIEIDFRLALGVPMGNLNGLASPELGENYERIRDLCERVGQTHRMFPALWGLWVRAMMSGEIGRSCELADKVLATGKKYNDTGHEIEAHHAQWTSRLLFGDPHAALNHCRTCDGLYRAGEHHELTYTYGGHDPGVCAGNVGAFALWLLGRPDLCRDRIRDSVGLARDLDHTTTLADAMAMRLLIATFDQDEPAVNAAANELKKFSVSERLQDYTNLANAAHGWILFERSQHDAGMALLRESVPVLVEQGDPWACSLIGLCASALVRGGSSVEGLELLDSATQQYQQNDVHWWEAELYRLRGELLLVHDGKRQDSSEEYLRRALKIAQQQQTQSLELRVAVSLARLWGTQGKSHQAGELLQANIQRFSPDLAFRDLENAKSLFAGLAGS